MPRKLPPFLHREITRHKRPVWYFRRGKGPRIRMPGEFNSVEFLAAYDAALKGVRPARLGHAQGTFAWGLAGLSPVAVVGRPEPRHASASGSTSSSISRPRSASRSYTTGSAATSRRAGTSGQQRQQRPECSSRRCADSSHGLSKPDL
jgi:hypothetical protein